MKNEILIIGKIPPPIGGVTVHVSRLIETLTKRHFHTFHFHDLDKKPLWKLFLKLYHYKAAHLHTSNPYFQLILPIYCCMVKTRLIITYHGNWGRFGMWKNLATSLSSWLTFIPILQNQESFIKSGKLNNRSVLISAFIPPYKILPLTTEISQKLNCYRKRFQYVFCTNASNLTFDKYGKETYGISHLIQKFSKTLNSALIISDPSGNNKKYLENHLQQIPDNVYFITELHDFGNVLKVTDAFIRNTTTDGDSISIHEAISYGTTVFATACVPRPHGCNLYTNVSEIDFEKEFESIKSSGKSKIPDPQGDSVTKILAEYYKCLV